MARAFRWKARHSMLSVLFVTSIVAFMDRMVMSSAIPYIAADFHLSSFESGAVLSAFFLSYSIAQVPGGLLADRYGFRVVTTIAMVWWSFFAALSGAATNLIQMLAARFLFGLGEGVFPAAAFKAIAVWFPQKERATANAVKLASSPLGGALAPLLVVTVMSLGSWRTVFYSLFIPGIIVSVLFWIFVADKPSESPRVSPEELAEIEGGDAVNNPGASGEFKLTEAFRQPYVLRYFLVLFAFDIGYWGFTSWLPTYLVKARGFSLVQMGIASSLPFFAATIGCLVGGWMSDRFFSDNRRVPIVATQLLTALLLYLTYVANSIPMLIVCQTLAGFCLSFFTSAFWALPMNTVPKSLMGAISGVINMAGQIAAFVSPMLVGYLVGASGGFGSTFLLLVVTILVSCALVFTLPAKSRGTSAGFHE